MFKIIRANKELFKEIIEAERIETVQPSQPLPPPPVPQSPKETPLVSVENNTKIEQQKLAVESQILQLKIEEIDDTISKSKFIYDAIQKKEEHLEAQYKYLEAEKQRLHEEQLKFALENEGCESLEAEIESLKKTIAEQQQQIFNATSSMLPISLQGASSGDLSPPLSLIADSLPSPPDFMTVRTLNSVNTSPITTVGVEVASDTSSYIDVSVTGDVEHSV